METVIEVSRPKGGYRYRFFFNGLKSRRTMWISYERFRDMVMPERTASLPALQLLLWSYGYTQDRRFKIRIEGDSTLTEGMAHLLKELFQTYRTGTRVFSALPGRYSELELVTAFSESKPTKTEERAVCSFSLGKESWINHHFLSTLLPADFFYVRQLSFSSKMTYMEEEIRKVPGASMATSNLASLLHEMPPFKGLSGTGMVATRVYELMPVVELLRARYFVCGNGIEANRWQTTPEGRSAGIYPTTFQESLWHERVATILMRQVLASFDMVSIFQGMEETDRTCLAASIFGSSFKKIRSCWLSTKKRPWCGECLKCRSIRATLGFAGHSTKFLPLGSSMTKPVASEDALYAVPTMKYHESMMEHLPDKIGKAAKDLFHAHGFAPSKRKVTHLNAR